MQLSNYLKVQAVAQATTADSTSITIETDMANFEGALFIGISGSTSAIDHTMTVNTAASTTATFVALSGGAHTDSAGGGDRSVVDVYRPRKRFLQGVYSSTAAGKKAAIVVTYGPRKLQSASTDVTAVVSPDT